MPRHSPAHCLASTQAEPSPFVVGWLGCRPAFVAGCSRHRAIKGVAGLASLRGMQIDTTSRHRRRHKCYWLFRPTRGRPAWPLSATCEWVGISAWPALVVTHASSTTADIRAAALTPDRGRSYHRIPLMLLKIYSLKEDFLKLYECQEKHGKLPSHMSKSSIIILDKNMV